MADNIQATPRNELLGLLADAMYGGLDWMKDPRRTQQMQGLAGLLESTGIPKTTERMAYGEPLTNIGRANVPLLKPETADALMTVAPFAPKGMKMIRATEGLPVGMSIKNVSQDGLIIKKGYSTTSTGREKPIWNIVDTNRNDEIVETFDRKGDASWLLDKWRQNTQQTQSKQLNAPQQAALDLAQQRAALPVSEGGLGLPPNNTPEMRAAAMGFDVPAYHGTAKEIDFYSFQGNPAKQGQTFVALDPAEANIHALGTRGSRVMPLLVNPGRMAPGVSNWAGEDAYAELAKRYGRESFKVRDDYNSPINLSILNQSNIRSRFAAFDPFRKDIATATAMGVAAPDLLAAELPEEELKRSQSSGLLFP